MATSSAAMTTAAAPSENAGIVQLYGVEITKLFNTSSFVIEPSDLRIGVLHGIFMGLNGYRSHSSRKVFRGIRYLLAYKCSQQAEYCREQESGRNS